MNKKFLIIDGSSLLSTNYYGNLTFVNCIKFSEENF